MRPRCILRVSMHMGRRARIRRVAKWVGTCLTALVLAAWGASYAKFSALWLGKTSVTCFQGELSLFAYLVSDSAEPPLGEWLRKHVPNMVEHTPLHYGYFSAVHMPGGSHLLSVPIWLLLLVVVIPSTALWWLDRRRILPGHCGKCAYDLTGNVTGRCPECGEAVPSSSK